MSSKSDTALDKALTHIADQVATYRRTDVMDCESLSAILQQLTATVFYIEGEKAKIHEAYQLRLNQLIIEGMSVNKAENIVEVEYPLMYRLRKVTDATNTIIKAIISQISYAKNEKEISKSS